MACESLRIAQIDSAVLDTEFKQLALEQVESAIEVLPYTVVRKLDSLKPEVSLLLDSCLWSIRYSQGASLGQIEEDVAYKDYDTSKINLHYCWSIILPYLAQRASTSARTGRLETVLRKVEALFEIFSLAHYLRFLRRGGHSTIPEQILGLRNWNNNPPSIGTVNYETQNRELLWHAFRDGLQLAWPFFAFFQRYWMRYNRSFYTKKDENCSNCGVCSKTAVIPVIWHQCGHIACYWCDRSRKEGYSLCAVCNEPGSSKFKMGEKMK